LSARAEYIVEMKGISKRFGGVQALKNVDLELRYGEIMGIVGDNGAGKSTLMKILAGAYVADEGKIYVDGREVHIRNPSGCGPVGDRHDLPGPGPVQQSGRCPQHLRW
jgi:ABC-type sugar transport system ATPase subunit